MTDAIAILEEHRIVAEQRAGRFSEPERPRLAVKPLLVVVNKWDDETLDEEWEAVRELEGANWPLLPVSAAAGRNLEQLKQAVFQRLQIMRIYSKPPGKEPNLSSPFVMRQGGTVEDFAAKVHKDFLEHLKAARVWGQGVHDGQLVGRDHVLHDGDVVELRI